VPRSLQRETWAPLQQQTWPNRYPSGDEASPGLFLFRLTQIPHLLPLIFLYSPVETFALVVRTLRRWTILCTQALLDTATRVLSVWRFSAVSPLRHPGNGTSSTSSGDHVISLGITSSAGTGVLGFSFCFSYDEESESKSKSLSDSPHGVDIIAHMGGTKFYCCLI
jgi:hypothetical protein